MGLVSDIFTADVLARIPGSLAIGHTRYSTTGDSALLNAQPIMVECNKGKIALAHNGNITNAHEVRAATRTVRVPSFRPPAIPKSSST